MTLSSTSRQQRKSMLPKPRPSSRISARRVTSGDTTTRIARRIPSPLLAMSCNNSGSITTQATVCAATLADCNLPLPEAGLRRAGSPSRIVPWSAAGQTRTSSDSCPTPDQSEAHPSLIRGTPSPNPEVKKRAGVNVQYPTPPASTDIKHERFFKGQEGQGQGRTTIPVAAAQHQDTPIVAAGAVAPPARHPSRRPASLAVSTTLTLTNNFSRVDNASPGDASGGGIPALNTWKKPPFVSSSNFSGKENRRPRMYYTRVPPPPVASAPTIPPRSIRSNVVARPPSRAASFRETPPPSRPLVIRKQLPLAAPAPAGSSPVRSTSGASGALPVVGTVSAEIQTLIGDVDRFAKEWTEMFDELSTGAGDGDPEDRLSKLDPSIRIHPIGQPENTGSLQADNPVAVAGKRTPRQLQPGPSGYASVGTPQPSTLAGTHAETVPFDASVTRWKHRDKSLAKDTPENRPERDLPLVASASVTDPQTHEAHHLLQKALLRNVSRQTTQIQVSRHLPSLPETDQSSIISGSHRVGTTPVVLSNRNDEASNLPQTTLTTPRGIDTARRSGILQQARCYSSATVPNVSSSPLSNVAPLSAVSFPYSSPPWVNLRANDSATQCPINATGDAVGPTRSSSLHGLRAIFKRTSAGLTGSHRQRSESLKERIGEPCLLSLGSISISNLRDAGVVSGCALPMGQEESTTSTGDLARFSAVK